MPSTPLAKAGAASAAKGRILALDIFRGMTIAFMIIVNTPGNGGVSWGPLRHAAWHGFTPTDLVFPSFLFIIGVSAWFSLKKFASPGGTAGSGSAAAGPAPWGKIWRRTTIIFLIGMLMWYVPGLIVSVFKGSIGSYLKDTYEHIRVLGVLGRLALCYGIGSTLALLLSRRGLLIASGALLLVYWGLMYAFGEGVDRYGLQTNAALRFDLWLLGPNHLYHGESVNGVPYAFDPEGVLSTLPAIVTFILGYLTGRFIDSTPDRRLALSELFPRAFLLIATGFLWSYWLGFPINKKIWTSSYNLYVGGMSLLLLSLTIWWVDVKGFGKFLRFFDIFGRNPLLAYITSELGVTILDMIRFKSAAGVETSAFQWIYQTICVAIAGDNGLGSFVFSILYMLSIWILSWIAYKRELIIKV